MAVSLQWFAVDDMHNCYSLLAHTRSWQRVYETFVSLVGSRCTDSIVVEWLFTSMVSAMRTLINCFTILSRLSSLLVFFSTATATFGFLFTVPEKRTVKDWKFRMCNSLCLLWNDTWPLKWHAFVFTIPILWLMYYLVRCLADSSMNDGTIIVIYIHLITTFDHCICIQYSEGVNGKYTVYNTWIY